MQEIRAVGFDLDETLYPETQEIRERLRKSAFEKILSLRPGLENINRVKSLYQQIKSPGGKMKKLFMALNIDQIHLIECFSTTNVVDLISGDDQLTEIIEELSRKYFLFIISGSFRTSAIAKLNKIGIDPNIFNFSVFGDDPKFVPKTQPDNFKYLLSISAFLPGEHVYIGEDEWTDIQIPKSLGLKTIALNIPNSEADLSIIDIHQIKDILL